MRVVIAAVGRLKEGPERTLAARYLERLSQTGRSVALAPVDVVEAPESRARRPEDRKREEASALAAVLPAAATRVALDARGRALSSEDFAAFIGRERDAGAQSLAVVIGGADGLLEETVASASLVVSFGAVTWPHQLVRVMAAEQLYRAATILAGHPYHRG